MEENSQKRANAGSRKPEAVRHDQLNLSLGPCLPSRLLAITKSQYRAAADRRVARGFPQCPQLSAFLGSAFLTRSGELSASSNFSGARSCGAPAMHSSALWEGSGASFRSRGTTVARGAVLAPHSPDAAARHPFPDTGRIEIGPACVWPCHQAALRVRYRRGLHAYRGMRINGQRVATWSSQHGWSGM